MSQAIHTDAQPDPGLPSRAPLTRREAFARLVARLERHRIRYCLVGDTRSLPDDIRKDVDVLADLDSFGAVLSFVEGFCAEIQARLVQLIQHERNAWYFCLAWTNAGNRLSILQVDFCRDFCQDARFFLSHREILEGRVWEPDEQGVTGGFYVPAPALEFIYYVVKRIDKGSLARTHGEHISAQWCKDPAGARRQLQRFWSSSDAHFLAEAARAGAWERLIPAVPSLRARLRQNVPISVRGYAENLWLTWRRLWAPPGVSLGLLGGSADLRHAVAAKLVATFAASFYHFQLVDLRECSPQGRTYPNPNRSGLTSPILAIARRVREAYRRAAFALGRHRLDLGRATLIVIQGEALDAQPAGGGGCTTGTANLAEQVLPPPDLCILLDPAEDPVARAGDPAAVRGPARNSNGRRRWRQRRRVDPSGSVEDVAREIEGCLAQFLSARLRWRLATILR